MKASALILGLCVLVLSLTLPKQRPQILTPDFGSIMEDAPNERFQRILSQLLTQLQQRGDAMDHVILGDFLLRYGYCEASCAIYQLATQKDPTLYHAHHGCAVSLDELGYLEEAIAAYTMANTYAEDAFQVKENRQRQGVLYLCMERVEDALSVFESLDYAPALVKRCRIYLYQGDFDRAKAEFDTLRGIDTANESLELYQLNALAQRHFGKALGTVIPDRQRQLIYSQHEPLAARKELAEGTFGLGDTDLYGAYIRRLPVIDPDPHRSSDQHILSASHDPQRLAAGEKIYRTSNCIVCHGPDAYGVTGPNLRDGFWLTEQITPSTMYLSIYNGSKNVTMPAYKDLLSPEQIRDVCGWLIDRYRQTERRPDGSTAVGKEAQGTQQELLR